MCTQLDSCRAKSVHDLSRNRKWIIRRREVPVCRRAELQQTEIAFHLKEQSYLRIKLLIYTHCLHTHVVCFHFRASQRPLRQTPGLCVLKQRLKQLLRGSISSAAVLWVAHLGYGDPASWAISQTHTYQEREPRAQGDLMVTPCNTAALAVKSPQDSLTLPERMWSNFCFALLIDMH